MRPSFLRTLLRNRLAVLGVAILLAATLASLAAPVLAGFNPERVSLAERLKPPVTAARGGGIHLLGTDVLGRDLYSRVIYGIRTSIAIGMICSLGAGILGTLLGLIAGYNGGFLEDLIMRLTDMQLSFPFIVLAIAFIALVGASIPILVVILIIWAWPPFARVVRADTRVVLNLEYIAAARAMGVPAWRILLRHVLPNIASAPIVLWTFVFARLIIAESSLSFLGLGVPPPTPTLGQILSDGRGYMDSAWWISTFPGLVLMLIVLAANIAGDGVRDSLDPMLRS